MIFDGSVRWVVDRSDGTGFCRGVDGKVNTSNVDLVWSLMAMYIGAGDGVGSVIVAGVGRGIVDKVYSDVGDDSVEWFEWKVGVEVGSSYGKSCRWYCFWRCHKFFIGIKRVFNIRVVDSVGWYIGRVIGSGVIIYIGNEVGSGDNGGVKL